MAGVSPAARGLAEQMADSYYAARGLEDVPAECREALVAMLLPAAMVVTETQEKADALAARLDMHVSAMAELMLLDAEESGELDVPEIPDFLPARWAGDVR